MSDDEGPVTMTVEEAGALLGISRRSAHRAAAAGISPPSDSVAAYGARPRGRMTCLTSHRHTTPTRTGSPHQTRVEQSGRLQAGP